MTKLEIRKALEDANAAPYTPASRVCGCGRAYVCVYGPDRATLRLIGKAVAEMGFLFSKTGHYGTGPNSIYIGYDNADGHALAKSEVFARVLTERLVASGCKAYSDAVAD